MRAELKYAGEREVKTYTVKCKEKVYLFNISFSFHGNGTMDV